MKKINLPDLSRSPTLSKLHLITNSHNIHFVYLHMSLKVFLRISKTEEIKIFCFTRYEIEWITQGLNDFGNTRCLYKYSILNIKNTKNNQVSSVRVCTIIQWIYWWYFCINYFHIILQIIIQSLKYHVFHSNWIFKLY